MKNVKRKILILSMLPLTIGPTVALGTGHGVSATITAHAAEQQNTQPVDLTVSNNSGKTGQMYIYMIGKIGGNGKPEGYVDSSGSFHIWNQANSPTAIPAVDASIMGPSSGGSTHLKIPVGFSGRIYYSFGSKMDFKVVKNDLGLTGTVQPIPWNSDDPSRYQDFDFTELTYDANAGLYFNATQVDSVSEPAIVSGNGDTSASTGGIKPNGFTNLVNELLKTKGFEKSVQYDKSGNPLRVLAPDHFITIDSSATNYLDPYINNVWNYYSSHTLKVQTDPTNNPNITYTGKIVNGVFTFTKDGDTSGYTMRLDKPSTVDVWGCNGDPSKDSLFAGADSKAPAGRDQERGTIMRSICADLHRGVLGTQSISPSTDSSTYYQVNSMNQGLFDWYSKYVHENMPNGKAYGFAFDDVGGYESLVHIPYPTTASINVINRGQGVTTTTPTSPSIPTSSPTTTPTSPTSSPTTTPTTPTTTPTSPTTTPITPSLNSSQSVNVTIPNNYPGYMTLNLGAGTDASAMAILVDGKQVSTVSVNGSGSVRADVPVTNGMHTITVKSLNNKNVGALTIEGLNSTSPTTSPTTTPSSPSTAPTTGNSKSKTITGTFTSTSPGYGDITFGAGTKPSLITIKVDGGSTSTIAINGPGTVRANMSAPAGTHNITVSSNDTLGDVSVNVK